MRRWAVVVAFSLVACGQPSAPPASAPTAPKAEPAPVAELSPDVIASRIAALAAPFNTGDYAKGKRLFAQCRSCHTIDASDANRVGPHLHGVMGRTAGSVAEFRNYSASLKASGIVWDATTLDKWIANPRDLVATNNMVFPGIRAEEDRRDLIAYIAVESAD